MAESPMTSMEELEKKWEERARKMRELKKRISTEGVERRERDPVKKKALAKRGQLSPFE